ncbi:MAG: serine/threonine-protein kinase [Rhizonema sp. PD37]|nr:serine/threonine-protein kinase [Rhizonema sp. PD37]
MHVYCSKQHANKATNRFCSECGETLPLPVGQMLENRYRIVRLLGHGGFGRTYLAEDIKQSNQKCVIKEFAPQVEEQQDLQKAKELFEREASVLKKLDHPQIPHFHASLQVKTLGKDFFFLVQDYVEGENYWELLENRNSKGQTFSEEEVITLLQQLLPVLSYIHSLDVVHRDLSPDNLILRKSDNLPVLIDFGGVKQLPASKGFWFTQLAGNRTLLGKKGYAPEEQLRQGQAYPSSDLYSLAVTALVLLTGKEPQKLYESYEGEWRWGEEIKVSPKLEAVLKKMLAYKPNDRYQKAEQVLHDLQSSPVAKPANSYLTKLKTMVAAPGRKHVKAAAGKLHNKTQAIVQAIPLPVWLRPFAISLVGTSVVIMTFAGTWAVVTAVVHTVTSITIPKISLPIPQKTNSPKEPANNPEPSRFSQISSHRQKLEIPISFFNQTVNEIFYTKHPEARGRSLTGSTEDTALRKEWLEIAEDLLNKLEQADMGTAARHKLGSYTPQDYTVWRQKAQAGNLGNYTINQLNTDTYQKFDSLFPGQQHGKLNIRTYAQIWYAMAAEQVNKREK